MKHLQLYETFSISEKIVQFKGYGKVVQDVLNLTKDMQDPMVQLKNGSEYLFNRETNAKTAAITARQLFVLDKDGKEKEINISDIVAIINESKEDKPKKKLISEMSKDEKIAMYRAKISDERKKPSPSQQVIDELKSKIDKANKPKE